MLMSVLAATTAIAMQFVLTPLAATIVHVTLVFMGMVLIATIPTNVMLTSLVIPMPFVLILIVVTFASAKSVTVGMELPAKISMNAWRSTVVTQMRCAPIQLEATVVSVRVDIPVMVHTVQISMTVLVRHALPTRCVLTY